MRRVGRGALVIGVVVIAGVVASLLTSYALLRVDPGTVLSSCSFSPPAHSCSSAANPWGTWLPAATGILGMAAVAALWTRRRRVVRRSGGVPIAR